MLPKTNGLLKFFTAVVLMAVFAVQAKAQTVVYMHSGTQNVPANTELKFYDDGGPAAMQTGSAYYWEKWYSHNFDGTLTFKNEDNKPIKVTFNQFEAWGNDNQGGVTSIGQWALRINDDNLFVYEGTEAIDEKLIAHFTGNIKDAFSVMANGPITFKFVSNERYREEGWAATVTAQDAYGLLPPSIVKEICGDFVVFHPANFGAAIHYRIGETGDFQVYEGAPVQIELEDPNASVTVYAKTVKNGGESSVTSRTFTHADHRLMPGVPQIERVEGTNTIVMTPAAVPASIDDTYIVRYTTDGTDPASNNGIVYSGPFEHLTPNSVIKAICESVACVNNTSEVVTLNFGKVYVPTPVITFDVNGSTTITCALSEPAPVIRYTTNGITPTATSAQYTAPFTVTAGTTVKAIARVNAENYLTSQVATAIYIPQNGNGTYGNVVLLDDREDHGWSYYSDASNPVRSLNPADVKISYFGNGENTVATSNETDPGNTFTASTNGSVKVGVAAGETQDRFVYLKTLEREDGDAGTGRCAYTLISNPFSVRPTYETGDTKWRGFYGWRVKALSGGTIYSAAEGGNPYGVGAIIDAETELYFEPAAETGMEVAFEALWARAYVTTNTNLSALVSAAGYERNFLVLNTGSTEGFRYISKNVTITSRYPDGTGGDTPSTVTHTTNSAWWNPTKYNVDCQADLKLENIKVNIETQLSALGHNLVLGRGLTGSVNGVYGAKGGGYYPVAYTMRIESGNINNLFLTWNTDINNNNIIFSSKVRVKAILGCDYDRAQKDDNKLHFNERIYAGNKITFNSVENRNNLTFDWYVKSGTFQTQVANGEADYALYASTSTSKGYFGKRRVTVEGGNLASIAGGIDNADNQTYSVDDGPAVTFRIKGGTVRGSVYGAAEFATSRGDRRFVITGGTVQGWIAGGCNGIKTTGGELYGDTYIYMGGKAQCNSNGSNTAIASSYGGNLFGAGSGKAGGTTVGQVNNSTVVLADNAFVERDVFGGGNYGYVSVGNGHKSDILVLGGTVQGNVFGGSNQQQGQIVNLSMKNGTVGGNLYGGSNVTGTVNGLATVSMSGGSVSNVFGGGLGENTDMAAGTKVTVSGGTVTANVYGGGEQGTVTGNTDVTVSGGAVNDVYGAGKGDASVKANIDGSTKVTVSGGTVKGSVFGGGENGTVSYASGGNNNAGSSSVVHVTGGTVQGDVFGGGKLGTSQCATTVTVEGGSVRGNVYGGAFGEQQKVFVTGLRTVNILGGHIYGNVYGGSRNANDAEKLEPGVFANYTGTSTVCAVNISGGQMDQDVYGAGYYGNTFGSVYVFIGKNAIENAPHHSMTPGLSYPVKNLIIVGSVWAGGDWGTFSGAFGGSTISGNSNIYVDGTGYETQTQQQNNAQYMNIGASILGCGTSCDAGKQERTIIVRNYGHANSGRDFTEPFTDATRSLFGIQRPKVLILDNAHINFSGLGRVNALNETEKYAIYEVAQDFHYVNGSSMFLNSPISQIKNFGSESCSDVYASDPQYTVLGPDNLGTTDNKIRVNGGNYMEVKYLVAGSDAPYGKLLGYTHMMASANQDENTCAYARPKKGYNTDVPAQFNNENDGGFVSYDAAMNVFSATGYELGTVQMAYENHTTTRNGEQYFRIWRAGDKESYREAVFNAHADGTNYFATTDVTITLPAFRSSGNYYCFETIGDGTNTSIDYGSDVLTFNAANTEPGAPNGKWMYWNEDENTQAFDQTWTQNSGNTLDRAIQEILKNPDVNFGLMTFPTADGGMNGGKHIICLDSDRHLADQNTKFGCADNTKQPQITFRLTYHRTLSSNMTWDPMKIVLVQKDASGNVTDRVTLALVVNTSNTIDQEFNTKVYAVMNGKGSTAETYRAKVVLPTYSVFTSGQESKFNVKNVVFTPQNGGQLVLLGGGYDLTKFALNYKPGLNYDNTDGWTKRIDQPLDATGQGVTYPKKRGEASGRNHFALDFTLHYNGQEVAQGETLLGVITFTIEFDNYQNGTGPNHTKDLIINVEVWRRGAGTMFYLDGINGKNSNSARYPDMAAKSLNTIFNRSGFLPGDVIYVVNEVKSGQQLIWNGSQYNNVTLYRYNGGHPLSSNDVQITGNPDNTAYTGPLASVNGKMTINGITLDGYYNNGSTVNLPNSYGSSNVEAQSPLIEIASNAKLELGSGVVLRQNNNTGTATKGGAVWVKENALLMMNQDAKITENRFAGNGAGVYMNGIMIASDKVQVWDNKHGDDQSNVFLTDMEKVIQIGKDGNALYGPLTAPAHIGATKQVGDNSGYVKVVYAEQNLDWLEEPYVRPNTIIVHDGGKFQLEKYDSPNHLYWLNTWVTLVTEQPDGFDAANIDTPEKLAWVISLVNGENGQTANPDLNFTVVEDLDMSRSIWVPIGTPVNPYAGTFDAHYHVIEGLHSSLVQPNMGMFGVVGPQCRLQNASVSVDFNANATNIGAVAGLLEGRVFIKNITAGGKLQGGSLIKAIGGLVGKSEGSDALIHSCAAVVEITSADNNTACGGLVGVNAKDLLNSYSNATINGSGKKGGLVGENMAGGNVENCYAILGEQSYPAFAAVNNGSINYCYADKETFVGEGNAPEGSATYTAVADRKHVDYMYRDNLVAAGTNSYVGAEGIQYENGRIKHWNGLMSALNQWVNSKSTATTPFTSWQRPTSANINGDLPVFRPGNTGSLATIDGKFIRYCESVENVSGGSESNAFNSFLSKYNDQTEPAYMLYFEQVRGDLPVSTAPNDNVNVFVNEDAVLKYAGTTPFKATTGITFDNSGKAAYDYWGNLLAYDWHMMSTPLRDASMGTVYQPAATPSYEAGIDITSMENGYFPNDLPVSLDGDPKWDFYTYSEPHHHWINFKRSSGNHWDFNDHSVNLNYTNETVFTPGKGYLMAIDKDCYLSQTGTLNGMASGTEIKINVTGQSSLDFGKGCNLLGNPYQAYLDLSKFVELNSGMSGKGVYVYDADQKVYVAYTAGVSANPAVAPQFIHPHQAFFVTGFTDATSPVELKFDGTMATHEHDTYSYFRGDQVNYPLVNLFAENAAGQRDLTVIEFDRPETGGCVKQTALRMADFTLGAYNEGSEYGILFTTSDMRRIPVYFKADQDGVYTLTWETHNGTFSSLRLVDNLTGVNYDMLTNNSYTFQASPEDYASRFYLTYACTGIEEEIDQNGGNFAFFDGSQWVVNGKGRLEVIDMTGRVLHAEQLSGDQNRVALNGFAKGVYLMRISSSDNVDVQKIVVR